MFDYQKTELKSNNATLLTLGYAKSTMRLIFDIVETMSLVELAEFKPKAGFINSIVSTCEAFTKNHEVESLLGSIQPSLNALDQFANQLDSPIGRYVRFKRISERLECILWSLESHDAHYKLMSVLLE